MSNSSTKHSTYGSALRLVYGERVDTCYFRMKVDTEKGVYRVFVEEDHLFLRRMIVYCRSTRGVKTILWGIIEGLLLLDIKVS